MFVSSKWRVQEISESKLYFVFCLDVVLNFCLVVLVMLCNLYIVFASGAGAQDIITKVVILDFILMQQASLKRDLFTGASGKVRS